MKVAKERTVMVKGQLENTELGEAHIRDHFPKRMNWGTLEGKVGLSHLNGYSSNLNASA